MKTKIKLSTNDFYNESAVLEYINGELIFFTKPKWVRLIFGIVGEALASAKERFRINISEISNVVYSENWAGKKVLELSLNTDDECKLVFNNSDVVIDALLTDLREKVIKK